MNDIAAAREPRSAFGVLTRRVTIALVAILVGLAAVSWWRTVENAHDMKSMVQGVAQVGRDMPFDISAGLFLSMWVAMMVAMMFPTIAPIALLHRSVVRRRGGGAAPTVAFVSAYVALGSIIGLVAPFARRGLPTRRHRATLASRP